MAPKNLPVGKDRLMGDDEEVLQAVILADSFNKRFRPLTTQKPRVRFSWVTNDGALNMILVLAPCLQCAIIGLDIRIFGSCRRTRGLRRHTIPCISSKASDKVRWITDKRSSS